MITTRHVIMGSAHVLILWFRQSELPRSAMLAAATGPSLDQIPPQKRLARNHMFHVYVLTSATIRHRYVGFSENLDDRFCRHNAGESNPRHGTTWILL